jgi:hypothetical protein
LSAIYCYRCQRFTLSYDLNRPAKKTARSRPRGSNQGNQIRIQLPATRTGASPKVKGRKEQFWPMKNLLRRRGPAPVINGQSASIRSFERLRASLDISLRKRREDSSIRLGFLAACAAIRWSRPRRRSLSFRSWIHDLSARLSAEIAPESDAGRGMGNIHPLFATIASAKGVATKLARLILPMRVGSWAGESAYSSIFGPRRTRTLHFIGCWLCLKQNLPSPIGTRKTEVDLLLQHC